MRCASPASSRTSRPDPGRPPARPAGRALARRSARVLWFLQRRVARTQARRRDMRGDHGARSPGSRSKAQIVVIQTADARYVLGVTEHGVNVVDRLPVVPTEEQDDPAASDVVGGERRSSVRRRGVRPDPRGHRPDRVGDRLTRVPDAAASGAAPQRSAARLILSLKPGGRPPRPSGAPDETSPAWSATLARCDGSLCSLPRRSRWSSSSHSSRGTARPGTGDPGRPGRGRHDRINGVDGGPSGSILTLLGITLLFGRPALLLMMSSFTKIFVVLAMTRNALSLPTIPPNQVLGRSLPLPVAFIMWPVLTEINTVAVQPYIDGGLTFSQAIDVGQLRCRSGCCASRARRTSP